MSTPSLALEEPYLGQVKWFTKGYGFITILNNNHVGQEVFVHHSAIKNGGNLESGEYVQFFLEQTTGKHKFQVSEVSGVLGGLTLFQYRQQHRTKKSNTVVSNTGATSNEITL